MKGVRRTALFMLAVLACAAAPVMAFALSFSFPRVFMPMAAVTQAGGGADEETRARLEAVRQRMRSEKAALAAVLSKAGGVQEKLEALQARSIEQEKELLRLETEIEIVKEESRLLAESRDDLKARADRLQGEMDRRIRARYRFSRSGLSRVLISARDVSDLSRRMYYLDAVFRADRGRLLAQRELLDEWSRAGGALKAKQDLLSGLKAVAAERRQEAETERAVLEEILDELRAERKKHEARLAELRASSQRLMGVIATLDRDQEETLEKTPRRVAAATGFAERRGSLSCPANGPIKLAFGKKVHPVFNTETMHNGIEIDATAGVPVRAVHDGVVRFAEWFRGYGNLVIIDHGDGYYSVYAHLAAIGVRVGQEVKAGETIGAVGDTGSIDGPSLYFEIRHHQRPLNPEAWLGSCG